MLMAVPVRGAGHERLAVRLACPGVCDEEVRAVDDDGVRAMKSPQTPSRTRASTSTHSATDELDTATSSSTPISSLNEPSQLRWGPLSCQRSDLPLQQPIASVRDQNSPSEPGASVGQQT